MKIISNRKVRVVFAWQDEISGEFMLSPFAEAKAGRRPMDRFSSKEELEAHVEPRGCEVQWLTS